MVNPADPARGNNLTSSMDRQLRRVYQLGLYRPLIVSAMHCHRSLRPFPTDGWMPASASRSLNRIDVPEIPIRMVDNVFSGRVRLCWRVQMACSIASRTMEAIGSDPPAQDPASEMSVTKAT